MCKPLLASAKSRIRPAQNAHQGGFSPARREMAAPLLDEINIVEDIAFKVQNGEWRFYGFVDIESYASELYVENPKEVTHAEYFT